MEKKESEFLKRLLQTFKVEAGEHLKEITSGLIAMEKAPSAESRRALIETIFREAHSLKGAARAVNAADIEKVCQSLESVFAALKRQEISTSPELYDALHRAVDTLGAFLLIIEVEQVASPKPQFRELVESLEVALKGDAARPLKQEAREKEADSSLASDMTIPRTLPEEKTIVSETIRVSTAKLDAVLLQAEEMLSAKLATSQRAVELKGIYQQLAAWEKEWTKFRPDQRMLDRTPNRNGERHEHQTASPPVLRLLEFLEWNKEFIETLKTELTALVQATDREQRTVSGMVDNLLNDTKEMLMLPFSTLLGILPRLVRELARDQGKEVELVMRGGEIEIDRRILEEMKDPLIHLIRNCLDHGLEKPDERRRKGKPATGTITIGISSRESNYVEFLITDNGRGLDLAGVKTTAVKQGILSQQEAESLSDQDAVQLVFHSGVSTSPIITDLSGRGLGLTIVKEKVEKLSGTIAMETRPDAGMTFRIILPLRLTTFRGVLVRVNDQHFILPTTQVDRVLQVNKTAIKTVENRETIPLSGQAVSLAHLGDVLELPRKNVHDEATNSLLVVVMTATGKRIAFLVDEVLNEQEVLVKRLGLPLQRVRNIAGATVLGNGKVVPILNVSDLMKSAVRLSAMGLQHSVARLAEREEKRKSVLVAEDSITSRSLLKNILEAAGYKVETAVDGIDAFTKLRSGEFDIVVSDVEMPRLDGFGLTAKIRNDRKLTALPVVLVTALESREDRERGIEVGANAYIVKSSFDQSNLLEVIQRLI